MFEEFRKVKSTRVPSAQNKTREDYLDLVLGKLPEIAESQRGTANKFFPSQKNSEASTMDKTEDKTDLPEVVDVETENKKGDEEEDFWVWQAKQEAWRKIPIFKGTPKG